MEDSQIHPTNRTVRKNDFTSKIARYHEKTPGIRSVPFPVVAVIFSVFVANVVVWAAVGIVLTFNGALASTAVLAYVLGLRHALDADHISAIDLTTRRLVASGQKPVTVGTFFSLGHSTIVIVTSLVVAATAAAVRDRFDKYSRIGGIVGSSVSAGFLIILGVMNVFILVRLIKQLRAHLKSDRTQAHGHDALEIAGGGFLVGLMQKLFRLIDRPWKMYPLGVLFGLGFDTSSEVALLGISSIQAAKGASIWLILIFPVLFTAGMCLLDTTDGALMMTLYTSTSLARDTLAILYYSIVLTMITILVAILIGSIQLLSLIRNVAEPTGPFWDGIELLEDYYDVIGASICASFIVFGGLSVLLYKPWRRYVDGNEEEDVEEGTEQQRLLQNEESG